VPAVISAELEAALPSDVVELHPKAVDHYLGLIQNLSTALKEGSGLQGGSAATAFRNLVESVIVHPVPPRAPLDIEIKGYLAELTKALGLKPSGRHSGFEVVAEEGLEPPTRGL
jgi:site-specific DNA recombinase